MTTLTQAELKRLFRYEPSTGQFIRLVRMGRGIIGVEAGTTQLNGYRSIFIKGRRYFAHRLAFLYMLGRFPENDTDHINAVRADNRWSNLREATRSLNMRNISAFKNNKSGLKGVAWRADKGKWRANIKLAGRQTHLGYFPTAASAHAAYAEAARHYFGDFHQS